MQLFGSSPTQPQAGLGDRALGVPELECSAEIGAEGSGQNRRNERKLHV